jgi:hypothetical protein
MRPAFDVIMRLLNNLLGFVMIAVGSTWIMQGSNAGPEVAVQSFVPDDAHWVVYGAVLALVGIGELVWSNTRAVTPSSSGEPS